MAVVSVLSEPERRVLAAAEALLLENDEALVRSFDALGRSDRGHDDRGHDERGHAGGGDDARTDPAAGRAPSPRDSEPTPREPAAEPRRRSAPMYDRLLRTLLVLGLVGMLVVSGWIFYAGDGQIRLLTGLVMFPVLGLTTVTAAVLGRRGKGDET